MKYSDFLRFILDSKHNFFCLCSFSNIWKEIRSENQSNNNEIVEAFMLNSIFLSLCNFHQSLETFIKKSKNFNLSLEIPKVLVMNVYTLIFRIKNYSLNRLNLRNCLYFLLYIIISNWLNQLFLHKEKINVFRLLNDKFKIIIPKRQSVVDFD